MWGPNASLGFALLFFALAKNSQEGLVNRQKKKHYPLGLHLGWWSYTVWGRLRGIEKTLGWAKNNTCNWSKQGNSLCYSGIDGLPALLCEMLRDTVT